MFTAQDAMSQKVIAISPDATLEQAIRLLIDHHISGAPVVDGDGKLVGIVSEYQLLEVTYDPTLRGRTVSDFMTKAPIAVPPSASLAEVVTLFVLHRIRRMPVVDNGQLVGIIARRDVLRCMAENRFSFYELNTEELGTLVGSDEQPASGPLASIES
jgi:CBS domain-containing protein